MQRRSALTASLAALAAAATGPGGLFGTRAARAASSTAEVEPKSRVGRGARASEAANQVLHSGRVTVLLRHAHTGPGIGDPADFRLGDCTTQRNLDTTGRVQARAIGAWFRARRLEPASVRSSRWCRCLETATLAFGHVDPWQALDSIFRHASRGAASASQLRQVLSGLPSERFDVWITHQVNITELTGDDIRMGEAFVVRPAAPGAGVALKVIGRWRPGG